MKTLTLAAAIGLAVISTSCTVLQPSKKTYPKTMSGASAIRVENPKTADAKPAAEPVIVNVKDTAVSENAIADTMAAIAPVVPTIPPVAAITMQTALGRNLGGEWSIIQVGSTIIDRDEEMPYITFEPASASFYANNGCNTLNGAYSVSNKDEVTFYNVLSTMRYCADVKFDSQINTIVADNVSTKLVMTEIGQETFVDFVSETGKSLMRLRRGNLEFLNGQWDVVSISGLDKLEVPADIFFDLGELKLHGNTGCNFVNGDIYLDYRKSNAVDFSNMGTTRMACPYTAQETAMLVALQQATTAISDGKDSVMLLDGDGHELMTLRRAQNEDAAQ